MKIATYVTSLNCIFWYATLEQTVRSALEFSDGVAVFDTGSKDGTIELLQRLQQEYGKNRLVYEVRMAPYRELGIMVSAWRKNRARELAIRTFKPDWLMLLDSDEVMHEKDAYTIINTCRRLMNTGYDAIWFSTLHFYRSWKRIHGEPWYRGKVYMTKNRPQIRHDKLGEDRDTIVGYTMEYKRPEVRVYHYGWARPDHVLAMKFWRQKMDWYGRDYWLKNTFYIKFKNPEKLEKFSGSHPKFMAPFLKERWRWMPEFDERDTSLW